MRTALCLMAVLCGLLILLLAGVAAVATGLAVCGVVRAAEWLEGE